MCTTALRSASRSSRCRLSRMYCATRRSLYAGSSPPVVVIWAMARGFISLSSVPRLMSGQCRLDRVQQRLGMEGLVEEGDGTSPEAPLAYLVVAVSRQDDGRNSDVPGCEMPEEVEAAHTGHPYIEHQTTGALTPGRPQEVFRRGERLDAEAHRSQEISDGPTQRFVIVHDGDHPRVTRAHALALSLERRSRIHRLSG